MTFSNYKKIIDEGKEKGLQQVALGGAGNPNDHESFYDILKYTRDNGIVPNYTTSGINLTDSMAKWSKEFCGAAAVSWHYTQYSVDALHKFMHYGCKTNIHFVVNNKTIDDAIHLLEKHELNYDDKIFDLNKEKINAIIFLLYKPIGLGKEENMLTLMNDKDKISKFFMLINNVHPFSIGFDSCSIPGILNFSSNINPNSIDTCEGGRFSGYINAKMQMVPCSFDQKLKWSIDLNQSNIEDAWNSDTFNDFRNHMKNNCKGCNYANECMGGCPIENKIVLCDNEKRRYNA
jgi:radical SAM protein with 4Fe4S-binding SPASM domain